MTDKKAILAVKNLRKRFGKKIAVKNVQFQMEQGEIIGLLGPNGAGKTTVFYMIVGFIHPTAGNIFLDHHNVTKLAMYKRARQGISYLPQEASVFRKLTVRQNILAILETRRDLNKHTRDLRLKELLAELGIEHIQNQKAYTLSGGERRRTEIARSLAIEPRFLLLDEPFAGIDPIAVYEIKKIIGDLSRKGIGILITDHNVRDTLEITHRSYIINAGEIIVHGTKEDLLASEIARQVYLGHEFSM